MADPWKIGSIIFGPDRKPVPVLTSQGGKPYNYEYIKALEDKLAEAQREIERLQHRGLHAHEHDPANGKFHGSCDRCGEAWPCKWSPEGQAEAQVRALRTWRHVCTMEACCLENAFYALASPPASGEEER